MLSLMFYFVYFMLSASIYISLCVRFFSSLFCLLSYPVNFLNESFYYVCRAEKINKIQTIPGSLDIAVDCVPLEHPSMISFYSCKKSATVTEYYYETLGLQNMLVAF